MLAGWTFQGTFRPASQITLTARTAASGSFSVLLSFTFLLRLINLKTEQKERDDRVVTRDSHPMDADIEPHSSSDLMCAFWVTLTNHFDLKAWLWVDGPQAEGRACSGARRGDCNGRSGFHIPKQSGHDSGLRPLPRRTRPRCSTLLAHAILFLGLHGGIPAATSTRNQNQNISTRYFAFRKRTWLLRCSACACRA